MAQHVTQYVYIAVRERKHDDWNCRTLLHMHTRTCVCGALVDLCAANLPCQPVGRPRHGSPEGRGVRERGSNDPPPPHVQANFPPAHSRREVLCHALGQREGGTPALVCTACCFMRRGLCCLSVVVRPRAEALCGHAAAEGVLNKVREDASRLKQKYGHTPGLGVVIVGAQEPCQRYVAQKHAAAEALGFRSFETVLPEHAPGACACACACVRASRKCCCLVCVALFVGWTRACDSPMVTLVP